MDAVLNWLWQGGVVAVAWFVMARILDRARANVRYVVGWAALLLIIAIPAVPSLRSAPLPEAYFGGGSAALVSLPDSWWTSTLVMLALWASWAGVSTVRLVFAMLGVRRARARGRAFPSHVESELLHWNRVRSEGRVATLVLSDFVSAAAVLPGGTPMIAVAPSLVRTLDSIELDRVLIHEWAHVQRRDDVVNMVQGMIRVVVGWHPGIWWIDRRLHVEREMACDEMTVAITGSRKSYAECLIKLASLRAAGRAMEGAPAVVTVSGLSARVKKIVTPHRSIAPVWSRSLAAAIVSVLCVMSVGVAGLELVDMTSFALPPIPSRITATTLERLAPPAIPTVLSPPAYKPAARRTTRPPALSQRETAQHPGVPPLPPQDPKGDAPIASGPTSSADSPAPSPAVDAKPPVVSDASAAVQNPELVSAPAKSEQPPSPWAAAADGGVAIGRTSKKAGVATAGFFTRLARSVAGSY